MKERKGWMKKAYSIETKDDITTVYAGWADTYDAEVMNDYGYVAPQITVGTFAERVSDRSLEIIDIGCGTGLAGEELKKHGFKTIDGLDYSAEMLAKAAEKDIYRAVFQGDLTGPLDIEDDKYGGLVCVGVFAMGHVGPEALSELVRIVKPGGVLCFSVNGLIYNEKPFEQTFKELEERGLATCEKIQHTDYIKETGVDGYVITLCVQ